MQKGPFIMDIKTKKRKLIVELMEKNPEAQAGGKIVSRAVIALFLLRLFLMIYELVFFSASELDISIISNLLLLPFLLILYMIFDGNKGLSVIPIVSAVIRVVIYFSGSFKQVSAVAGGNAYTAIFLVIMLLQFAVALLVCYASKCQVYFKLMQTVNFQIQKEFLSGGKGRR